MPIPNSIRRLLLLLLLSTGRQLLPPLPDRDRQVLQYFLRVFPAYAGVGDRNAVLEAGFAFGWNFLISWGKTCQY